MDASFKDHAKQKKPDIIGYIIQISIYMKFLEKGKNAKIRKSSSCQGLGEREGGLTAQRPEGT